MLILYTSLQVSAPPSDIENDRNLQVSLKYLPSPPVTFLWYTSVFVVALQRLSLCITKTRFHKVWPSPGSSAKSSPDPVLAQSKPEGRRGTEVSGLYRGRMSCHNQSWSNETDLGKSQGADIHYGVAEVWHMMERNEPWMWKTFSDVLLTRKQVWPTVRPGQAAKYKQVVCVLTTLEEPASQWNSGKERFFSVKEISWYLINTRSVRLCVFILSFLRLSEGCWWGEVVRGTRSPWWHLTSVISSCDFWELGGRLPLQLPSTPVSEGSSILFLPCLTSGHSLFPCWGFVCFLHSFPGACHVWPRTW